MIREVSHAELVELMPMAAEFHRRLKLPGVFSKVAFCQTWGDLIREKVGFVMARWSNENPVEAVGLIVSGDMYSGLLTVCSAFWMFTTPPQGLEAGLLYKAVEDRARKINASQLMISTLRSSPRMSAINGFLNRSGFQLVENTYRKAL